MAILLKRSKRKNKEQKYLIKKMIKYIKRDKFKRLKHFMMKNDIHPDSEIGCHARTPLHECGKRGSTECIRILIQCKADPMIKDLKENYPLHLALKYLLKQKNLKSVMASELIDPLKKNLNEHIHDTNSSGTSCWQLLTGLDVKIKILKQETISSSSSSDSDTSSEASENEWNEKLKQAHEEDYIVNFGKCSESLYKNEYQETYDEWADRIYNAFQKRHQKTSPRPVLPKCEARSSSFTELKLPAFKPKYPCTNDKKIIKYNELFAKKSIILTSDLPFCLKSTADEIISLLLSVSGDTNKKKVLREAIRKWHPDKFIQVFSEKIDKNEFNDVIAIVNHVSQTLLLYGK